MFEIKPLKWKRDTGKYETLYCAETSFMVSYQISKDEKGWEAYRCGDYADRKSELKTLKGAKEWCEDDYRHFILPCLKEVKP